MVFHRVKNFNNIRPPTPFQRGILISPTYSEFENKANFKTAPTSTLQTGYADLTQLGFPAAPG